MRFEAWICEGIVRLFLALSLSLGLAALMAFLWS